MTRLPPRAAGVAAVLTGLAVPCMVFGKVGIVVPLVPAAVAVIVALGWSGVRSAVAGGVRSRIGVAVCATAVLWFVGVVHTLNLRLSFEAWSRTFVFVAAAVVLWRVVAPGTERSIPALKATIAGMAVALGLSFLGVAVPEVLGLIHADGWTPQLISVGLKQFASPAMLLVPVLIWAAWRLDSWWRWGAAVEVAGILELLVVTESRSSFAALVAILVAAGGAVAWRRRSRRLLVGAAAAALVAVVAVFAWMESIPIPSWPQADRDPIPVWLIDLPRQEIWAFIWRKIMESPWIGHGINVVNYLPGASVPIPGLGDRMPHIPGHPHNWALEIFAETGGIGLAAIIVVVGGVFWRLLAGYRETGDAAFLAALSVHVGYWVAGLFTVSFWSAWWQVSYLVLLALTFPGRPPPAGDRPATEAGDRRPE